MESISFNMLLDVLSKFGYAGALAIIWWFDRRDIKLILDRYEKDMLEQRKMYENNVKLCESFASISKDLKEIVIFNTQQATILSEEIHQNQYCPAMRLEKKQVFQKVGG